MFEFRSGLAVSVLLVALAAASVVSMAVDRRAGGVGDLSGWGSAALDVAVPVQKMIAMPADVIREAWINYVDLLDVRDQNDQLRDRLAALEEENLQLREALVASGRLQRIAEMRESFEIAMLPSQVVGADASPWFRSVLVDRGRSHGVRPGMPVISEDGLVGLVRATSGRAAKAALLLDRQSAVDGTIQRSRARGMVRGRGTDALEFEFVARDHDVRVGDMVITSGLGGVYPKGLRIGVVTSIEELGTQLMLKATLQPSVDFHRLEHAFVMLRRGPTMELLHGPAEGERDASLPPEAPAS